MGGYYESKEESVEPEYINNNKVYGSVFYWFSRRYLYASMKVKNLNGTFTKHGVYKLLLKEDILNALEQLWGTRVIHGLRSALPLEISHLSIQQYNYPHYVQQELLIKICKLNNIRMIQE